VENEAESANVVPGVGRKAVAITTDGTCITNTLAALEEGAGSGKPMSAATLAKICAQTSTLLEQIVSTYETDVASGEVGAAGSGRASDAAPTAGRCPTGLLYGRIQSGKTVGMITLAALAIDNGFRVIVVLTSDNVKLVDQTATRFSALDGIIRSSTLVASWPADASHIRKALPEVGLVLVCAKNQSHLDNLVDFLESIDASKYPALIMDDEADQATLDTTINAKSSGRKNAPKFASTINRRTVKNDRPDEIGRSVAEVLGHFVFLQVTATPYALLLQNTDNPLRPKFTKLLEPGDGYTGGEAFFSDSHIEEGLPPLMFVAEEESDRLERGTDVVPEGLAAALAFFLVAAGAQAVGDPVVARTKAQNFLCHTSQKKGEHGKVASLIRDYLDKVGDALRGPALTGEVSIHLEKAHAELAKTLSPAPDLAAIVKDLRQRLPRRQVIVVNSDGDNAEFARGLNFIIGGNILGRGLTIDNLLVTYYLRSAKVSQMDTMLQHARMFGYRSSIMTFTRVFVPHRLALRFHRIHTAEHHLRALLADPDRRARIPVEIGEGLRSTRPGVLDMNEILAYTPGQHIYPGLPLVTNDSVSRHEKAIGLAKSYGAQFLPERGKHQPVPISFENMAKLIAVAPFDPSDEDTWDPRALQGLLRSLTKRFGGMGWLYTRQMKRERFARGALGGPEVTRLGGLGQPVLCLFQDVGKIFKVNPHADSAFHEEFSYPSLVLPDTEGMPAHMFNVSE
jgi:hypothetical protein